MRIEYVKSYSKFRRSADNLPLFIQVFYLYRTSPRPGNGDLLCWAKRAVWNAFSSLFDWKVFAVGYRLRTTGAFYFTLGPVKIELL